MQTSNIQYVDIRVVGNYLRNALATIVHYGRMLCFAKQHFKTIKMLYTVASLELHDEQLVRTKINY